MASAEEPGEIIVNFTDKQLANAKTVYSVHTSLASQASKAIAGANLTACPELPATSYRAGGYIQVMFRADSATDIIESEESSLQLPILILNRTTGQIEREYTITFDNATGFTSGGTVDLNTVQNVPIHLCYWEVPDGKIAMLKAGAKFHVYIGDDS